MAYAVFSERCQGVILKLTCEKQALREFHVFAANADAATLQPDLRGK